MPRRRKKSSKGMATGAAALVALGLLFGGDGSEQEAKVTPTPAPRPKATVTVTVTASPALTASPTITPTITPMVTATPTAKPASTPTQTKMVWISKSGTRYHCIASCSGMKDPTEIPEDEAIARGRKPCQRCY